MRVVVVGAGLGGLCVAQGLVNAGIDVDVLEARPKIDDAAQGYRININATGHAALRANLTDNTFAAYERTLHRQSDAAKYLYSPGWQLISREPIAPPPGAIDRAALRRVLADGLTGRIHFGQRVATPDDIGSADLIIAADGVDSALRRHLLPGHDPEPLGRTAIFGRAPLDLVGPIDPVLRDSRFCAAADARTVLALCAYDPPVVTSTRPYVMWVLMVPSGDLPASTSDLAGFARDRTADWDSRATRFFAATTPADTFATPLRAMTHLPDLPARGGTPVAFLGDAIHAMSPAGGEGANTALADAARLVSHLRSARTTADAVADYHAGMRDAAGAAITRSATYGTREPAHV